MMPWYAGAQAIRGCIDMELAIAVCGCTISFYK